MDELFKGIIASLKELRIKTATLTDHDDAGESEINAEERSQILDEIATASEIIEELSSTLSDKVASKSFFSLLTSFYNSLSSLLNESSSEQLRKMVNQLLSDAEKLSFISSLATLSNTAVIVGANGSGKSTFVNSMADMSLGNLTVIPAQKNLYFSDALYDRGSYSIAKYRQVNQKSTNEDYKKDDTASSITTDRIFAPFTLMITALVNEVAQLSTDERHTALENRSVSTWDNMMKIWKKMIPEISFQIDSVQRKVIAKRNNEEYSFNRLSDGEKCILFYIGNVLLAKPNSYVVVDEPETFLNAAVYNKLWDILIEERSDCQFVFTSHNIEFITARKNAVIVWCKQFTPPNNVELRPLDANRGLPIALLAELIGSRRRILFCEGTEDSFDYQIFSSLYLDDFTVKPVGGHEKVIEYTRVFNELPAWVNNSAVGIIDRDGLTEVEIQSLQKTNVTCLPCNEIEMLLIDQTVMERVVGLTENDSMINKRIMLFKDKLFELCSKESDRIVYTVAKNLIDSLLRSQFINSRDVKTTADITKQVENISSVIQPDTIISSCRANLKKVLTERDFEGLRQLCTLKGEVVNGLANKWLQPGYSNLALGRISQDERLQKTLRHAIGIL